MDSPEFQIHLNKHYVESLKRRTSAGGRQGSWYFKIRTSAMVNADRSPEFSDEETPLLGAKNDATQGSPSPLPKLQLCILLLMLLSEPISFSSISPYISRLISGMEITHGDESRVGYYIGLMTTGFFVGEATTIFQWSRMSDRMGRKPVLLFGLTGLCFAMLLFGLSRTFSQLAMSRFLAGMLNGNAGLIRTMFTEITNESNRAQVYALIPVTFSVGVAIGPLIGGWLEHPQLRFPSVFSQPFWREYPYFLPCACTAAFIAMNFVIANFWLKETLPPSKPQKGTTFVDDIDKPLPLRALLTPAVVISIINQGWISFIGLVTDVMLPMFYATSFENGGLDLPPQKIGSVLGTWGLLNGIFQQLFFARLIKSLGERGLFMVSLACWVPVFALCPVANLTALQMGYVGPQVWTAIALQLLLLSIAQMGFGAIFLFTMASAPNKRCLGAVNGLAQNVSSIVRALSPIMTVLLSLSIKYHVMGGYAFYFIMMTFSIVGFPIARRLPMRPWNINGTT